VYDGELYKELGVPGALLSDPHNLSLTWNVDGFPLFKSSKFSIWPLYFVVNELPFKLRMVMENTILGGLWFGEAKLNMSTFFKPIFSDLTKLERVGVEVQSCLLPHAFISKVILAGTCDLPAKCMVLNMMQFNENNGCAKCLQPGITYNIGEHRHTHIYPFCSDAPDGPKRTKEQHHVDAKSALSDGTIVNGIQYVYFTIIVNLLEKD